MTTSTLLSRFQFAFTITYHYLFPQLTMGLALLLVILKTLALRTGDDHYNTATRFWTRIFAITFVVGVVTGIPMEFEFGTNWSRFSASTGSIIAQTLAMEGAFAFFLESAFLGIFLFGERTFSARIHWLSAVLVWAGTWASGGFIIATNAWMQHPVGYTTLPDGRYALTNYWQVLLNPWILPQYLHTMGGAVITATFVMAGVGAYYLLLGHYERYGKTFVTIAVIVGFIASVLQLFPSGDMEGRQVTAYQPIKLAAMEGLFRTARGAAIVILGQPNMTHLRLDNPIAIPHILSLLTYRAWSATVKGLESFPRSLWPDNVPLVYYSYHIMVGLGTFFIAIMGLALLLLLTHHLWSAQWMLWILLLATPFPYISNTAGWLTAELGRQPWIVYGLMQTANGSSAQVSSGNVLFTLIGFSGMYLIIGLLYVLLIVNEFLRGPQELSSTESEAAEAFISY